MVVVVAVAERTAAPLLFVFVFPASPSPLLCPTVTLHGSLRRRSSMYHASCSLEPSMWVVLVIDNQQPSGIAFANFSTLFAHATCVYTSAPFTFTFFPNSASVIFPASSSACFSTIDFCTIGLSGQHSLNDVQSSFHVAFFAALREWCLPLL